MRERDERVDGCDEERDVGRGGRFVVDHVAVSEASDEPVPELRYSREMGVTDEDFFRLLPKAMGAHPYRVEGRTVRGEVDGGSVEIELGPQQERRIALLRLPFAEVSFTFRDVTEAAQQAFKRHFDLYFQRGGG